MLADFLEEHRKLLAALEDIATSLKRTPPVEVDELTRLRVRFGTLARQHLHSEEEKIFRPLTETGLLETLPKIQAIMQDMRAEWATYSANVREWTLPAIMADRAGYLQQIERRTELLRSWNRIEEEQVYRPALAALEEHRRKQEA
ncbi:MAG: hypothetical protein J7494_11125 [Sphingobium sp.]|nr:hypothetical protein [Sphingobium sp.]